MPVSLPATSTSIRLLRRPVAAIDPSLSGNGTFGVSHDKVPSQSELKAGEALVSVEWLSLDPAMRGWLNDTRSYVPPVQINEVMRSGGIGRVAALGPPKDGKSNIKVGDWVSGMLNWQEVARVPVKALEKVEVSDKVSPSYYLGAFGMPAQTAYWGLEDVAKIKAGETVVISGAAGAVGTVACQMAKIRGCKVIAIAGGADKCKFLKEELGVDEAIDYKSPNFKKEFREKVGYLDVYFDNVGGEMLDLALTRLKKGARIALCGAISAYNERSPKGLQQYLNLISQRAKIEGFIVFDYASKYHIANADLARWFTEGKLKIRETRIEGLEKCPEGLVGLFSGKNTGKLVVKVKAGDSKL